VALAYTYIVALASASLFIHSIITIINLCHCILLSIKQHPTMAPSAVTSDIDLPKVWVPSADDVPKYDSTGYSIPDKLLGASRPIRVLVIGFGAAGINISKILGEADNAVEVICYEKNSEVGGTWFENK
jgi:hypothetical protein